MSDDDLPPPMPPLMRIDMIVSDLGSVYAELFTDERASMLAELLDIRRRLLDFRDDLALSERHAKRAKGN